MTDAKVGAIRPKRYRYLQMCFMAFSKNMTKMPSEFGLEFVLQFNFYSVYIVLKVVNVSKLQWILFCFPN